MYLSRIIRYRLKEQNLKGYIYQNIDIKKTEVINYNILKNLGEENFRVTNSSSIEWD